MTIEIRNGTAFRAARPRVLYLNLGFSLDKQEMEIMQILVFIFMFITYADIFNTVFYNKAPSLCVRIFCFYFFLSKMKIYKSIFTVSMWTRKMYVFYSVSMRLMLFPGTVGGSSECFEIVFTCSCGLISF